MKKILCFLFIFTLCLTVIGCQESVKKNADDAANQKNKYEVNEGKNMNGIDIYDFEFIQKAPEAEKKHPLNEVIKVYFSEWNISKSNKIAIDIANNQIYKDPRMSSLGVDSIYEPINVSDTINVLKILEEHAVQNWDPDFSFEKPGSYKDGYSWKLWLQFEDGTVEKHSGAGTRKKEITPKNFNEFAADLNRFVNDRLEEK